jgi:hypothetical protein
MKTAEEILNDSVNGNELYFPYWRIKHRMEKALESYASQQVETATKNLFTLDQVRESIRLSLESAAEAATVNSTHIQGGCMDSDDYTVDKSSILSESNYKIANNEL